MAAHDLICTIKVYGRKKELSDLDKMDIENEICWITGAEYVEFEQSSPTD